MPFSLIYLTFSLLKQVLRILRDTCPDQLQDQPITDCNYFHFSLGTGDKDVSFPSRLLIKPHSFGFGRDWHFYHRGRCPGSISVELLHDPSWLDVTRSHQTSWKPGCSVSPGPWLIERRFHFHVFLSFIGKHFPPIMSGFKRHRMIAFPPAAVHPSCTRLGGFLRVRFIIRGSAWRLIVIQKILFSSREQLVLMDDWDSLLTACMTGPWLRHDNKWARLPWPRKYLEWGKREKLILMLWNYSRIMAEWRLNWSQVMG